MNTRYPTCFCAMLNSAFLKFDQPQAARTTGHSSGNNVTFQFDACFDAAENQADVFKKVAKSTVRASWPYEREQSAD